MEMTELGRFTERLAGKLSGGMKQKLGLACTLVRVAGTAAAGRTDRGRRSRCRGANCGRSSPSSCTKTD